MIKQQVEFMFGMSLNEPDKYFQSKTTNTLQFSGFEQTGIDCNFHEKKSHAQAWQFNIILLRTQL